jgi:class 3 adenylate cyclase
MYELVHCALAAMDVASLSLEQGPWYKGFDFIDPEVQALLPTLQYDDRRVGLLAVAVVCGVAMAAFVVLVLVLPYAIYEKIFLYTVTLGVQPLLPVAIFAYFQVNYLLTGGNSPFRDDNQRVDADPPSPSLEFAAPSPTECERKEKLLRWVKVHEFAVTAAMMGGLFILHLPYQNGFGYIGTFPFSAILLLYPLPFYGTGIARWKIAIPLIWVCTVLTLIPVAEPYSYRDSPGARHRKILLSCWTGVAATVLCIVRQISLREALRDIITMKQSIISLGRQRDDLELLVSSALPERVRTCSWEQVSGQRDGVGKNLTPTLAFLDVPSTVVFGDVVGFTNWCSKRSVMEIVSMLSSLFDELDRVAASVGICKVKTLGDAYWAVAGLVDGNPNHAAVAVEFALTLATEAGTRLKPFELVGMRVGVHTGPVSGGLIGPASRKSFEVFGAANQIAEDVQTAGQPGRVLVSEATYLALQGRTVTRNQARFVFSDGPTVSSVGLFASYFVSHLELDLRSESSVASDVLSCAIPSEGFGTAPMPRLPSVFVSPAAQSLNQPSSLAVVPISPAHREERPIDVVSLVSGDSLGESSHHTATAEKRSVLHSFHVQKQRLKLQAFLAMIDQADDASTALQAHTPTHLSFEAQPTPVVRFSPLEESYLQHSSRSMDALVLEGSSQGGRSSLELKLPQQEAAARRDSNPLGGAPKSDPRDGAGEVPPSSAKFGHSEVDESQRDCSHGTDRLALAYGVPLVLIGYPFALSIGDAIRFDPPSGICYLAGAAVAIAGYITLRLTNWNFRLFYVGCLVPYYCFMMAAAFFEMRVNNSFVSAVTLPLMIAFWTLWIWVPWYVGGTLFVLLGAAPLHIAKAVGWVVNDIEGLITVGISLAGVIIVPFGSRSARQIADRSAEDKQVLSDAEAARKQEFKEMESTAKCLVPPSQVPVLVQWLSDKRSSMTLSSLTVDPLAHVLSHVVVCFVEIHLGEQSTPSMNSASALVLASQLTTALEECIVEGRPSDSISPLERIKMIGDAALLVGPLRFSDGTETNESDATALDYAVSHMLGTLCALQRRVAAAASNFGDSGEDPNDLVYLKAGLSVGSVVAAVVGRSGLMFDVFGDSVNRASRSKSHCPPGSIAFEHHSSIEAGVAPLEAKLKLVNRFQTHFKGISTPINLCVYKFNQSQKQI